MSKEVNNEQTKAATQEETTELSDDHLDAAAGGGEVAARALAQLVDTPEPDQLEKIRFFRGIYG